jgi:hypothetical protein
MDLLKTAVGGHLLCPLHETEFFCVADEYDRALKAHAKLSKVKATLRYVFGEMNEKLLWIET